jgi:hypothetical protein
LIPDSTYPNELAGTLYWQDEQEAVSSTAFEGVRAFLSAVAAGRREAWLAFHFGSDFPRFDDDADAIYQICFKAGLDTGRCVYRCPECQRLHVQEARFENRWICYEPEAE